MPGAMPMMPGLSLVLAPVGVVMHPPKKNGLDISEILAAIETLYQDQLKPYGRILRKRLMERSQAARTRINKLAFEQLRATCESCPWLCVHGEDGGDWSAVIRGRQAAFVEVHSPEDTYPAALWTEAEVYFGSLRSNDPLPGGRYACAQTLMSRRLPFLSGLSLGQVCHIVQLAISEKKVLGYLNGGIVPYNRSLSKTKELLAQGQQPMEQCDDGIAIATWESLRSCLQEMISQSPVPWMPIPLANIKRLIRTEFRIALCETALGHAKLSELLQDERLQDICSVRLTDQGYALIPKTQDAAQLRIRLADHLVDTSVASEEDVANVQGQLQKRAPWIRPLTLEEMPLIQADAAGTPAVGQMPSSSPLEQTSIVGCNEFGNDFICPSTPSPWSPCALDLAPLHTPAGGTLGARGPCDVSVLDKAPEVVKCTGGQASQDTSAMVSDSSACPATPSVMCPPTPSPWSPCAYELLPLPTPRVHRRSISTNSGPSCIKEEQSEDIEVVGDKGPSVTEHAQVTAGGPFVCPPTPSPWSPCAVDSQALPTLLTSRRQRGEVPSIPCVKASSQDVRDTKQAYANSTPAAAASFMASFNFGQEHPVPADDASGEHLDVRLDTHDSPLRPYRELDFRLQNSMLDDNDASSPSSLCLSPPARSVSC